MFKALIFDVDGTIADTERDGHLPACNEAFRQLGFPIEWTWEEFLSMQHLPGNAYRMRAALEKLDPHLPTADLEVAARKLADLKRRLYIEMFVPRLSMRPGVAHLIRQALERGLHLAIVTTSDEPQVEALLRHHLPEEAPHFKPILGKGAGKKTAPDSPLYRRCLSELRLQPHEALAIDDSEYGCRAARAAELPVAVFYNHYTFGQVFAGAALVARSVEFFDLVMLDDLCYGQE
jgi:HAD superfamily hydrolase (TIGR01509 family)